MGVFWDEAHEGLDAYALFGKPIWVWPLFFTSNNGREPLFTYLVHLAQVIWGPSAWSVRVVSASAGALLTPAVAWLGWEIAPALRVLDRKQFALWAGTAVLAMLWSQTIARLAQRMSLFALLETVFFAALWRAWRTRRWRWWALAGIAAGLSLYTYLAVRAIPLLLVLLLGLAGLRHRAALRERWTRIMAGLLVALVVAGPLIVHFILSPGDFNMRTSQVDILSAGGARALLENIGRVAGMAFVRGDANVRLNYPYRPVLDLLTVAPFVAGLLNALRRFWRPGNFFVLAALGTLLLPTLMSVDAPNFGRSIGALPVFALLIASGLEWALTWASRRQPRLEIVARGAAWALLLASVVVTWQVYFVQYARLPELFVFWDTGYTQVARDIVAGTAADGGGPARVYADAGLSENPSVRYLLTDLPEAQRPHAIDGQVCVKVATDVPARYYVLSAVDKRGPGALKEYLPDSLSRVAVTDPAGNAWASVIDQPSGGRVQFPEITSHPVSFGDNIELLGYWLSQATVRSGDRLYVRLFWRVSATPHHSYTTLIHLEQPGRSGEPPLAGVDAIPGQGACPTTDWQPGEVIVDELQLVVPADAPAGEYPLAVGLYRRESMERLPVEGSADGRSIISLVGKTD